MGVKTFGSNFENCGTIVRSNKDVEVEFHGGSFKNIRDVVVIEFDSLVGKFDIPKDVDAAELAKLIEALRLNVDATNAEKQMIVSESAIFDRLKTIGSVAEVTIKLVDMAAAAARLLGLGG